MKIVLSGYGKMGKMIEELAIARGHEVLAAVDEDSVSQFETLAAADAVLDFSHPAMLAHIADYVRRTGTALFKRNNRLWPIRAGNTYGAWGGSSSAA